MLEVDLVLALSNGHFLELFSVDAVDPWVLRVQGGVYVDHLRMAASSKDLARRVSKVYGEIDAKGFDPLDVVYAHGSTIDALALERCSGQRLSSTAGWLFGRWSGQTEGSAILDAALDRVAGDRQRAEQSVNWTEVGDLFGPRKLESSNDDDLALAYLIREVWVTRLGPGISVTCDLTMPIRVCHVTRCRYFRPRARIATRRRLLVTSPVNPPPGYEGSWPPRGRR